MAGFLEKENTIVDMVLTLEGKRLLSLGELEFTYFALLDDEVDYDPYIPSSSSMSSEVLSGTVYTAMESSLVREAVPGYRMGRNLAGSDFTNGSRFLFSVKQGSQYLPHLTASDGLADVNISVNQRRLSRPVETADGTVQEDIGFDRFASEDGRFSFSLDDQSSLEPDPTEQGLLLRVFRSGSGGLVELHPSRDSGNRLTFGPDISVRVPKDS